MADLKPCPFCGSTSVGDAPQTTRDGVISYYVECADCSASATDRAAWNRREPPREATNG